MSADDDELTSEERATIDAPAVSLPSPPAADQTTSKVSLRFPKANIVVLGDRGQSRTQALVGKLAVLGRSKHADVVLPADDVSRLHAEIRVLGVGKFVILDVGSRNGTVVNGVPLKADAERPLSFGDRIQLGSRTLLLFTQHDEVDEQLRQLQKMEAIGHLAGAIAHDFNNLLTAILTNASFLRSFKRMGDSPEDEEQIFESLIDIEKAAKRGVDYTRQLLGFARRAGTQDNSVAIDKLIDEVHHLTERMIDEQTKVLVDVTPDLLVAGDRGQLHQVLLNLCVNARDALPHGGTIHISAHPVDLQLTPLALTTPGQYAMVTVEDDGLGMDDDTRLHIFEPFFTTKKAGKGTGLGLATAYGIVKSHGGHVEVETSPGQGSAFRVYLPLQARPRQHVTEESPTLVNPSGGKELTALLVDDEELVRKGSSRLLEQLGFRVLLANNGQEGVELFKERFAEIDIVLLDLLMPLMGGDEAFRLMRQINPDAKILIVSGYSEEGRVAALLAAGANAFVQKPFERDELARVIAVALDQQ